MNINNDKIVNFVSYSILLFLIIITILISYFFLNTFWGDSSIYLVFAKNIANSSFLSFNPGEFSSGATSPLWAFILSIGFLFNDNGIINSKFISLIFMIIAILMTYRTSFIITGSKIGSAIGVGFLWYFSFFAGVFAYESGLAIILLSALILLNYYIIEKSRTVYIFYLGIIWAILPFARPETLIIVIFNLFLLLFIHKNNKNLIYTVIGVFLISLIPITIYLSYSIIKTGLSSSSTYCRSFWDKSIYNNNPNGLYDTFIIFFSYPVVIMGFYIGGYGMFKELKENNRTWLHFLFLTTLISFILIFTIYSPLSQPLDIQRYLIPIIPFMIPLISKGISKIYNSKSLKLKIISITMISVIGMILVVVPPIQFITNYSVFTDQPLKFNDVTEKNMVDYLNSIAEPNSTILSFEVQDRYYLRPDLKILSQDGITDGKIAPFLPTDDITGFLWKYKPNYWIANQAVNSPLYSNSILNEVINKTGADEGSKITIDNITFKDIKIRNEPANPELLGYTNLYELTYN